MRQLANISELVVGGCQLPQLTQALKIGQRRHAVARYVQHQQSNLQLARSHENLKINQSINQYLNE